MKQYIENTGTEAKFIGGKLLLPGEGREFDMPDVPPEHRAEAGAPAEETEDPDAKLKMGLLLTVAQIAPNLPQLSIEELARLEQLELAGKNRRTLVDAIAAERLARADAALQAQQDAERAQQLQEAEQALLQAGVALANLPADASEQDRAGAQATVAEAQAKVDALKPAQA